MHEEADTRMFFHLASFPENSNVVLRTADADVCIIALGVWSELPMMKLWMEVGKLSDNTLRFISIHQLHGILGEQLCKSLMFFHALTGSDFTASFFRKGKVKPLKILEKAPETQIIFANMGETDHISEGKLNGIESFVCSMYGYKKEKSVDHVRLMIFLKKYKPKKADKDVISCVKNMEGNQLPPCSRVLHEKIKRANLVCSRWKSSLFSTSPPFNPEESGWLLKDGEYRVLWFVGPVAPKTIDLVSCDESGSDNTEDDCDEDDGEDCFEDDEVDVDEVDDDELDDD